MCRKINAYVAISCIPVLKHPKTCSLTVCLPSRLILLHIFYTTSLCKHCFLIFSTFSLSAILLFIKLRQCLRRATETYIFLLQRSQTEKKNRFLNQEMERSNCRHFSTVQKLCTSLANLLFEGEYHPQKSGWEE